MLMHVCILYIHISTQIVRAIFKSFITIYGEELIEEAVESNLLSPKNVMSFLHFKKVGILLL